MTALRNKDSIIQDVKTHLRSQHMLAYDSWISGCVEYFIEEGFSLTEIKDSAYQQWLLNDLKYICPGSLPENLMEMEKTTLNGQYVLQINSVLDISVPAYQQYLKMKKTDIENIKATMNPEEKISSKRMLKFELTDGKQIIAGMEYETLHQMKTEDIAPGSKIHIKGPVQCRQGMLLLRSAGARHLRGEVTDMLHTHSLAAQLADKLNLPVIDPSEISETSHSTNEVLTDESLSSEPNRSRQNDVTERPQPRQNITHTKPRQTVTDTNHRQNVTNTNPRHNVTNTNRRQNVTQSYPGQWISNDRPSITHPAKRSLETEQATEKKIKLDEEVNMGDVELDLLEEEDLLAIEECERLYTSNTPVITPTEPFVYIKQINDLSDSQKRGKTFKVKAQIQNVLTKLTMTANKEWNLKCTIIDGTGCMDVEFSSDILSKFLGYTPEKISELKKQVAANPGIKSDINLAYVKTAETLRTLYCIMELTMYTLPKITRLIDFEDSHLDLLKKRLNNEEVAIKISLR